MEDNTNTKKKKKSRWITAGFFAFSLVVVAVIAIMEFGGEKDRHLENIKFNFAFLAAAVGCFLMALLCETLKYSFLLRGRGVKNRKNLGFTCAVIGKYYDNITPAGAGGQGFQMYHLSKNGCDHGTAGGLPIIGFLGLQFAFVFIGIMIMIFGGRYIGDIVVIRATAIAGLVFYAFIPMCIILFAVAPGLLESIIRWGTRMGGRFHLLKDPEKANSKALGSLKQYTDALREFGRNTKQIIVVGLLSLVYQCAIMSIPFFVLRFFGADILFIDCFCRVVYIYAAMAIIFTPGNSGAAEASFYMVFSSLSGGAIFWGMLVWRMLCYYSWIILGAVVQLHDRLSKKRKQKKASVQNYKPDN